MFRYRLLRTFIRGAFKFLFLAVITSSAIILTVAPTIFRGFS
ncbi:hypothetical protein At15955_47450 (plasmid) [Agrobacterium tumefaciens]|nr:hypothetical protein X971_5008 [Agrobacterium tumefaciens LBA4213 (Ach5)]AKC10581.1 hypothetical protein Ach5_48140 [Agrobacterium tumefaciens]AYM19730.1 hypothetical protein At15955_47450 [Agrobacterium tumefaciens]AYM71032.1 hypothetical protein AtA6_48160 [Agrobacterium tumefaciens]